MTAKCVGVSASSISSSSLTSILQNPDTAPTGSPSDLRVRGGSDYLEEAVRDIYAGGGLGRTPVLGALIRESLPIKHLLSYTEAIMRVYNRYGRRDNKYKARIKIFHNRCHCY